jgi:hypothetical protein
MDVDVILQNPNHWSNTYIILVFALWLKRSFHYAIRLHDIVEYKWPWGTMAMPIDYGLGF